MGEGEPRAIASGLRAHCTPEEMQGRLVLVVCNLKPAKFAGFASNGMVLAAKSADGTKVRPDVYISRQAYVLSYTLKMSSLLLVPLKRLGIVLVAVMPWLDGDCCFVVYGNKDRWLLKAPSA